MNASLLFQAQIEAFCLELSARNASKSALRFDPGELIGNADDNDGRVRRRRSILFECQY